MFLAISYAILDLIYQLDLFDLVRQIQIRYYQPDMAVWADHNYLALNESNELLSTFYILFISLRPRELQENLY